MTSHRYDVHRFELGELASNCYVVSTEGDAVIIDPGGEPERVIRWCVDRRLNPTLVVATHGHFDHVGGVAGILRRWDIPFAASSRDAELYRNARDHAAMFGCRGVEDAPDPTIELDGRSEIGGEEVTLGVLATPGHSPGSVTLTLGTRLFTGDVLFEGSIGRTDLPGGDYDTLIDSITRSLLPIAEGEVFPGHGRPTTIAREKATNPFLLRI